MNTSFSGEAHEKQVFLSKRNGYPDWTRSNFPSVNCVISIKVKAVRYEVLIYILTRAFARSNPLCTCVAHNGELFTPISEISSDTTRIIPMSIVSRIAEEMCRKTELVYRR